MLYMIRWLTVLAFLTFEAVFGGENIFHFDLLYWKLYESNLVLINKTSPVFFTDDFTKTSVIHPHFKWDVGFRIGFEHPYEGNNIKIDWTHYGTNIKQKKHTNSNDLTNVNDQRGMFPLWALSRDILSGDYVSNAAMHWKVNLDLADLLFKGSYCLFDTCFDWNPYVGLRAAWIRQKAHQCYSGGIFLIGIIEGGVSLEGTDHVHLLNNFWGMGPLIGIQPEVPLGKGWSLYGNMAISGLLGCYHIKQKETFLDSDRFLRKKHTARFRWITDLAVGLMWDTIICQDVTINLGLEWEYHIFIRQLELKQDSFHILSHNRNLDVQGITFSSAINF